MWLRFDQINLLHHLATSQVSLDFNYESALNLFSRQKPKRGTKIAKTALTWFNISDWGNTFSGPLEVAQNLVPHLLFFADATWLPRDTDVSTNRAWRHLINPPFVVVHQRRRMIKRAPVLNLTETWAGALRLKSDLSWTSPVWVTLKKRFEWERMKGLLFIAAAEGWSSGNLHVLTLPRPFLCRWSCSCESLFACMRQSQEVFLSLCVCVCVRVSVKKCCVLSLLYSILQTHRAEL